MNKTVTIAGFVRDKNTGAPVENARVELTCAGAKGKIHARRALTCSKGRFQFEVEDGAEWLASAKAFDIHTEPRPVPRDCAEFIIPLDLTPGFTPSLRTTTECGEPKPCPNPVTNRLYDLSFEANPAVSGIRLQSRNLRITPLDSAGFSYQVMALASGPNQLTYTATGIESGDGLGPPPSFTESVPLSFSAGQAQPVARVALQRSSVRPTQEEDLWTLIRANSRAIGFNAYRDFVNLALCQRRDVSTNAFPTFPVDGRRFTRERDELISTFGVGAHDMLRTATELFLLLNCRVGTRRTLEDEDFLEESARRQLPTPRDLGQMAAQFLGNNAYLQHVIDAAFPGLPQGGPFCDFVIHRNQPALIELIWSYWHEEAMLVQSVNALGRRFQNLRSGGGRDPLGHFELDPLRPLNNILWGYVQDEHRRLTVPRRALEYNHHYGFTLFGKANGAARPADPRSKFLESFHNLLHRCSQFFKEDNDTTVIADGYPLLNALREVHLVLAQGAHNQFGDLPWTARVEMLMQQWIMARSETRDFLQSRTMVPYTEAWMPQVDTMKTVQGWTDVTVSHFHDLGVYGEQILLSIRYGDWVNLNDEDVAKNWARNFRPEIQGYLHSYRAVAGVDLANPDTVDSTIPAVHLQRRLMEQSRAMR